MAPMVSTGLPLAITVGVIDVIGACGATSLPGTPGMSVNDPWVATGLGIK